MLADLKTKKPKKGKGNTADLSEGRAAGRFGEVASLSKLYFDDGPAASASASPRGGKGSLNLGGRSRHRREFASVSYFDHNTANCPAGSPLGLTDIYIAKGVELALDAVMEGLPTDGLTIAGPSTAQANAFLAKGDALKNARNYKGAYQQYKMAYKAAVK